MPVTILAIESSCDETAAAVIQDGKIFSNIIASQLEHGIHGGVVPEMASRLHVQKIVEVVNRAFEKSTVSKEELSAIAFTEGPGLIGALMVGSSFAKAMALALKIPLIGVHHMQAHIHAHFLAEEIPEFPFLCLTVSGGHTQIVLVNNFLDMKIIGETLDDAAGEAFDKTARLLDLPYPGGPLIDRFAKSGNRHAFVFPEPDVDGYNFSFSGLKTSILYFLRNHKKDNEQFISDRLNDICASVQYRIVTILLKKLLLAAKDLGICRIALAGGVSSNSMLREEVEKTAFENNWMLYLPAPEYCTDNAAMIASVAYHRFLNGTFSSMLVTPKARMAW